MKMYSISIRKKMVVGGESAGGNLAATVALRIKEQGGPKLRGQFLNVPVTNTNTETNSYKLYGQSNYALTAAFMKAFIDCYAPPDRTHRYIAPMRARNLSGLPPALVQIGKLDALKDEGISYARALERDGVPVKLTFYEEFHGFLSFICAIPESRQVATGELKKWLTEIMV